MITRLDHIVLICQDLDRAIADYTRIFGQGPSTRSQSDDFETALFIVSNTALEILAAIPGRSFRARIDDLLGGKEGKLSSLAFGTEDIETAHHVFSRRGLKPASIASGQNKSRRSFRCPDDVCSGIKTFVVETEAQEIRPDGLGEGQISSLDHLVINTSKPERCVAHYGARLGLRFALDRTIEAFKTRFLFFRVGGLTLEIIHRLDQPHDPNDQDKIWGLTWAVDDLHAAHKRLGASGVDISPIRTGRKPGSEVFTLRNGTLDIPTLFISHSAKMADKRHKAA